MRTRLIFLRIGMGIGALLTCLAPVLAVLEVRRASAVLGSNGISDPHQLSNAIAGTMLITAGGLVLLPVGLTLLIACWVSLTKLRRSGPPPLPRLPENFGQPPDKG